LPTATILQASKLVKSQDQDQYHNDHGQHGYAYGHAMAR
jgi:hypothetical protein